MSKEIFDFYDRTTLKSYNLDKTMQYQLSILGSLDVFTRKHSENVANITCRICQYLHLPKNFIEYCTICAYLHDIGKQFIPASILQKQSALTEEEFEKMKTHTTIGYKICMDDLKLRPYAAGTLYHHEALNGTGYPNALTADEIPYEGKIIKVADEYDAIVSKRQYKTHIDISDTIKILVDEATSVKDPENNKIPIKDHSVGKISPTIVKALIKVVIDDTQYEISCIMDYVKDMKKKLKRLEQIEKYDEQRKAAKNEKKQNYYLEGMKSFLVEPETIDNYKDVLSSYRHIIEDKTLQIEKLFSEIKKIKSFKL